MSFSIRSECDDEDRRFIERLNSRLTEVITAPTHTSSDVRSFQETFTATAWEADAGKNATFLAIEETGDRMGYINVREGSDDVLGETCGYIALLAVRREHEGKGVAQSLVKRAEQWAKDKGYRRLALDVFASNNHAVKFYDRAGFQPETVRMIKKL